MLMWARVLLLSLSWSHTTTAWPPITVNCGLVPVCSLIKLALSPSCPGPLLSCLASFFSEGQGGTTSSLTGRQEIEPGKNTFKNLITPNQNYI